MRGHPYRLAIECLAPPARYVNNHVISIDHLACHTRYSHRLMEKIRERNYLMDSRYYLPDPEESVPSKGSLLWQNLAWPGGSSMRR